MSATITIEINDAGEAAVTVDGGEPQQFASVDECLEYVSDMLKGEEANEPGQAEEAAEPSMESMWNEEAAKRAPQPNIMR